jgi:hypothetical protein
MKRIVVKLALNIAMQKIDREFYENNPTIPATSTEIVIGFRNISVLFW